MDDVHQTRGGMRLAVLQVKCGVSPEVLPSIHSVAQWEAAEVEWVWDFPPVRNPLLGSPHSVTEHCYTTPSATS